uniref:SFRICE_032319 n=1 Tax=Spodoptera frugiperda TaxID=7108 RepID=A0A2H1WHE6_SPOFR
MWLHKVLLFSLFLTVFGQDDTEEDTTDAEKLAEGEKKLSENVLAILEHFKQPDPVGLPGAAIPDPYPVPDMKQSLSFGTLYFKNTAVYGISKFRILYVNAEIGAMEVHAAMTIDVLQARGNYTMSTWLNRAQGPFTVDVTGLKIIARATLGVERDGKLRAQDIVIDLSFSTIAVNFENLGFFGGMFQGIINTVGNFLFDSIKPYVLKEAYTKVRAEINTRLDAVAGDMQFPNSISPLDMVIIDVRKKVRDMHLDPYKMKDYNATVSVFTVSLTNTWITGISAFQRVGNITFQLENNTAIADFDIGTQRLEGRTQWDISAIGGLLSRAGTASFSVEYISARIILAQPLDTRKKPVFRDIDLEVGNIQVRWNGAGTIDYVIEFTVNVLPNLLRYQIMDAIEGPLRERVQQELDKLNVEEMIKEELPRLDAMQGSGFKLSDFKESSVVYTSRNMWLQKFIVIFYLIIVAASGQDDTEEDISTESEKLAQGEKKLSDNILMMLEHFRQPDPVGLPGDVIPDPCPVADMKQSLQLGTLYLTNTKVHGLSKLRILHVNAEVEDLVVEAALRIDALQARGNYSISSWFGSSRGPFTVDITGLKILAKANVGVEIDGKLRAQDIHVDLSFSKIATNFENLGFLGGMLQSIINTGGASIFDSSMPAILKEAYPKARAEINAKLEEVAGDLQFPNSISPLDMVIIDVRKKISDMKLDPYKIKDNNTTMSIFTISLANTWVTGISSFQRVGNITLKMENNTAIADFEVGTQKLEGRTQWDVSAVSGLVSRAGTAAFSIEYFGARVILAQPLDTRKAPTLRDIDLDIGNIQVRFDGAGTLDYVIEFAINVIPNLLRYQIMNAFEGPLRERIQQELSKVNVDELIKQELPKLDQMQETGFKLSALRGPENANVKYDEDEFFNF